MPWILLTLGLGALAVAFRTTSVGLLVLSLALAAVLIGVGFLQLLARRVDSRSRDVGSMLDPAELQRLRDQARARHEAASGGPDAPLA
ncbi:MAG: hypothetical protein Q4F49_05600 [Pseudoxanthomonas suwonensis]|nr:hypothetical protein [Pseudoxanthomonas suwonensis]